MGKVTSIIDALRRIGRPTVKNAIRRQDEQLADRVVLSRQKRGDSFQATIEPIPETIVPLTEEETRPIRENAAAIAGFLRAFGVDSTPRWSLRDLDYAFQMWLESSDKRGYADDAVIEIAGAAFGQYCIEHLDMRWMRQTDKYGTSIGLQGSQRDFRAFPFHTIEKRLPDREFGFFQPVFDLIKDMANDATYDRPA
jgi:hypothetical protein